MVADYLELRLFGDGIKPSEMRPKDIAKLIASFEDSLLHIISKNNSQIKKESILISFSEIRDESIGLRFLPKEQTIAIVLAAYEILTFNIKNDHFENLPNGTITSLKEIEKIVNKNKCEANFNLNGDTLASINTNKKIEISKKCLLKGDTNIYATVLKVGGVEPRAVLSIGKANVTIEVDEELAKKLAFKLYEKVLLKGTAFWSIIDYELKDFKVLEMLHYEEKSPTEIFAFLRERVGKYWEEIDDVNNSFFNDDENDLI